MKVFHVTVGPLSPITNRPSLAPQFRFTSCCFSKSLPLAILTSRTRQKDSGLDNSGKTTIVLKINGEDTSVISPTLGFDIKTIKYQKYSLNIWDIGGQKTIRSYWRNYFERTDGLVWVITAVLSSTIS